MRTNINRIACLALLVLTVSFTALRVFAQAPVAPPAIAFSLPNGATLYKANGVAMITASAAYAPGLRSLSMSGVWSGSTAYYPPGYSTASTRLYFYASYYPVGDYTIKATATGDDGKLSVQSILVHVK